MLERALTCLTLLTFTFSRSESLSTELSATLVRALIFVYVGCARLDAGARSTAAADTVRSDFLGVRDDGAAAAVRAAILVARLDAVCGDAGARTDAADTWTRTDAADAWTRTDASNARVCADITAAARSNARVHDSGGRESGNVTAARAVAAAAADHTSASSGVRCSRLQSRLSSHVRRPPLSRRGRARQRREMRRLRSSVCGHAARDAPAAGAERKEAATSATDVRSTAGVAATTDD
jgi:hypothetical protein